MYGYSKYNTLMSVLLNLKTRKVSFRRTHYIKLIILIKESLKKD